MLRYSIGVNQHLKVNAKYYIFTMKMFTFYGTGKAIFTKFTEIYL